MEKQDNSESSVQRIKQNVTPTATAVGDSVAGRKRL